MTPATDDRTAPTRYSPLHQAHVDAGASFTDFAGWQMPVRYSSDLAEHHAVRTAAGLFDLSHMGEIVVLGPERRRLPRLRARRQALGDRDRVQAKYSLLLARDGGIIDDLVVYRTGEDRFLVVANASNREVVAAELFRTLRAFRLHAFDDESDDIALIAVQGPKSLDILRRRPVGIDAGARRRSSTTGRRPATFQGHELLVARTGYTGEDGFELYVDVPDAAALWDALMAAGERTASCRPASPAATRSASRRACRSTGTNSP